MYLSRWITSKKLADLLLSGLTERNRIYSNQRNPDLFLPNPDLVLKKQSG